MRARPGGEAHRKSRMQAVAACLRKLVMICHGVLKNRTPLDPNWGQQ